MSKKKGSFTCIGFANYAVEQRIRMIDFLLSTYGVVDRPALMDFFGISSAQATRDLKMYKDLAPGNTLYNPSEQCYVKMPKFKPLFYQENTGDD